MIAALLRSLGFQVNFDFGGMDAFGMFVQFCASGSSPNRFDLWHLKNEALGDEAHAMRFGQRYARIEQHVDREVPSLKGGRKARGSSDAPAPATAIAIITDPMTAF